MKLVITNEDTASMHVDRENGFQITIGELTIEFEDEKQAERLGRMILWRLGVEHIRQRPD